MTAPLTLAALIEFVEQKARTCEDLMTTGRAGRAAFWARQRDHYQALADALRELQTRREAQAA